MEVAIELYQSALVKKILLSGDHRSQANHETEAMKKYILSAGVPAKDIFLDHAGFRTLDSIYRARDIFGVRDMIICTNRFHLPRALYLADGVGIKAQGVATDVRAYRNQGRWSIREFFARLRAFADLRLLKTRPHYPDSFVDMTKSGVITHGPFAPDRLDGEHAHGESD